MLRIGGKSAFVCSGAGNLKPCMYALFADRNRLQFVAHGWKLFLKPSPLSKQAAQVLF